MLPLVYARRHRTGCGCRGARTQPVAGNVVWFRHATPLKEYAGFSPNGCGTSGSRPGMEALRCTRESFATVYIRNTPPPRCTAR